MIALDTSSLLHYLLGSRGEDVDAVDRALAHNHACLPPVVLCEMLSDPRLPKAVEELLLQIPILESDAGFWERAGRLRAATIAAGHKAKLADVLIAQSCLDHGVALITRDADFGRFRRAGLQTVPE